MSQALRKKRLTPASLRGHEDAHTVLLRMASDAERAQRVRQLKQERPDLTWRRIAEAVGVSERSAIDWQKTGGMDYENAKAFAKLMGVKVEWLWNGLGDAPTPEIDTPAEQTQLDRIEAKVDALNEQLRQVEELLHAAAHERQTLAADIRAATPSGPTVEALERFAATFGQGIAPKPANREPRTHPAGKRKAS